MANDRTHLRWTYYRIKQRCYNPTYKDYHNYGARGIGISDSWINSFDNFYNDMLGTYRIGLTLERIDNNLGYSKTNCRWATMKEQSNNKRNNRFITYKGVTKTMAQWAEISPVKRSTFNQRYYAYGWDFKDCFKAVGA